MASLTPNSELHERNFLMAHVTFRPRRLREKRLLRRMVRDVRAAPDPHVAARIRADLADIQDEKLRDALARLGAAIKQS